MTDHPVTPPFKLVQQWMNNICNDPPSRPRYVSSVAIALAASAAQWGADQELEACCEWLKSEGCGYEYETLFAARRPKPSSLKEQALQELNKVDMLWDTEEFGQETLNSLDTIRKALEALPDD